MTCSFAIIGAPRTKNTGSIASAKGQYVIVPSKAYRKWFNAAKKQAPIIRAAMRGVLLPIALPVTVTAVWYRDRDVGDEDRFKIGLGDFLQRMGIVKNDALIHWSGGCARALDYQRPRTEVTIEVAA